MIKSLGVVLGGIFVGAVGMELFRRKFPNALENVYSGVRKTASGVVEKTGGAASGARRAFWEGYERVAGPPEAPEPSV